MVTESSGNADVEEQKHGLLQHGSTKRGISRDHRKVISYLWNRGNRDDCPFHIRYQVIALDLDMEQSSVINILYGLFGDVDNIETEKGYDMNMVIDALQAKYIIA